MNRKSVVGRFKPKAEPTLRALADLALVGSAREKHAGLTRPTLILLGFVAAIVPLSIDLYLPALPSIGAALHAGRGAVERSIPAYLIGLTFGQLIHGPLSDRIGRRPALLGGLGLYVLASLGCAVATRIESLTAWRLVQGFGGGAGIVLTLAIIRDCLDPQAAARALSALMLVTGLAPILAPLLGGWLLAATSWQGIFYFQIGFAVLCAAGLLGFMPETRRAEHAAGLRDGLHRSVAGMARSYKATDSVGAGHARDRVLEPLQTLLRNETVPALYARLLRDRRLIIPSLSGGFGSAGLFAYLAGSPFVFMQTYGLAADQSGGLFALNALGLVAVSQLNARWLRRRALKRVLRRLLWLPLLAGVALLAMTALGDVALPYLVAGMLVYISSLGAIGANTTAIAMAEQGSSAGAASAVLFSLQCLLATLAGLVVSLIPGHSALPMGIVMAGCGVLCFVTGRMAVGPRAASVPPSA